jgi:hypothetical protein
MMIYLKARAKGITLEQILDDFFIKENNKSTEATNLAEELIKLEKDDAEYYPTD